jgi:hypothetical protein
MPGDSRGQDTSSSGRVPHHARFGIQAAAPGNDGSAERIRYDFLTIQKVLANSGDTTTEVGATKWLNSESINPRF